MAKNISMNIASWQKWLAQEFFHTSDYYALSIRMCL